MNVKRTLGIDQGTTSTKALILSSSGETEVIYQKRHEQIIKQVGWVEHDPDEIFNNICEAIELAGQVDAIGLTHQGETVVAWDSQTKEALYNMIVWQDERTQKEVDKLKEQGYEKTVQEKTGLFLDSYFSASKIAWLINNVPKVKTALKENRLRIGTSESFFTDRLTNVYCTDYNTASRTSLFNNKTLSWDEELCKIFGVPIDILPPIKNNIDDFGTYNNKGISIPVRAVMVDQFSSIYAHKCHKEGDSKVTFGTGAFMQALTGEKFIVDDKARISSALFWKFKDSNPIFGLDAGVYNVGSAVDWALKLGLFDSYDTINDFGNKKHAIERNIMFIPALSGLAGPYWDRTASGIWTGLTLDITRQDLAQSVLEGIVLRVVDNLQTMGSLIKLGNEVSVDGGLCKNPYFLQFFADMSGKTVKVANASELTSLGIAQLAFESLNEKIPVMKTAKQKIYTPQKTDKDKYMERYKKAIEKSKNSR